MAYASTPFEVCCVFNGDTLVAVTVENCGVLDATKPIHDRHVLTHTIKKSFDGFVTRERAACSYTVFFVLMYWRHIHYLPFAILAAIRNRSILLPGFAFTEILKANQSAFTLFLARDTAILMALRSMQTQHTSQSDESYPSKV